MILATLESSQNTADGNPLQFITDWTRTVVGSVVTYTPALGFTYTNSNCSASGQPASISMTNGVLGPTIVMTLDNSQTVQFSPLVSTSTSITGTITSTGGGCTNGDTGTFSATYYAPLSGTYMGTIESYALTNPVNVTITLSTSASWYVTGTVQASNKSCLANLTIASTTAQSYGTSFASGDAVQIFAADSSGDVAAFLLTATDSNGNALTPPWPSQFFTTYMVLAGPCSGNGGTDSPFRRVEPVLRHIPIIRLPPRIQQPNQWTVPAPAERNEVEKESEDREERP